MEKTCKDCEHSGPPRNSKWPDTIYCSKNDGHYDLRAQTIQAQEACFTPKKPKEPERPVKNQEKPVTISPEEYQRRRAQQQEYPMYMYEAMRGAGSTLYGPISADCSDKVETPKPKEKTMLKKVRHLMRMIGMCWLMYGIFKLAIFVNPVVFWYGTKIFSVVNKERVLDPLSNADIARTWIFATATALLVITATYFLHKFTEFFFGKK